MTGSVEPVFRFLTCRVVPCPGLGKAWREKIPERSEDDFFLANQPVGPPCPIHRTRTIFAGKKLKYEFLYETELGGLKNRIAPFLLVDLITWLYNQNVMVF